MPDPRSYETESLLLSLYVQLVVLSHSRSKNTLHLLLPTLMKFTITSISKKIYDYTGGDGVSRYETLLLGNQLI